MNPPPIDVFGIPLWSIQLAISLAGLLVGSIIAAAGSIIAYRNAYGSAPLILVARSSLAGRGEEGILWAKLEIVFWNNRKYPIRHSAMHVTFDDGLKLVSDHQELDRSVWLVSGNTIEWIDPVKVGPQSSLEHLLEIPFVCATFEHLRSKVEITIDYFDPISNSTKVLSQRYDYDMTEIANDLNRMPFLKRSLAAPADPA